MPVDTSRLPALEEELIAAKQPKAGGQAPRPDRIAAIEAEIRACLEALGEKVEKVAKPKRGSVETADAAPESPVETADATEKPV